MKIERTFINHWEEGETDVWLTDSGDDIRLCVTEMRYIFGVDHNDSPITMVLSDAPPPPVPRKKVAHIKELRGGDAVAIEKWGVIELMPSAHMFLERHLGRRKEGWLWIKKKNDTLKNSGSRG